MNDWLKSLSITAVIMGILFFPTTYNVTIIKKEIKENRPFAGVINGQTVGTSLCVSYWLSDSNPDTATYKITAPLVMKHLGYIYSSTKNNNHVYILQARRSY